LTRGFLYVLCFAEPTTNLLAATLPSVGADSSSYLFFLTNSTLHLQAMFRRL